MSSLRVIHRHLRSLDHRRHPAPCDLSTDQRREIVAGLDRPAGTASERGTRSFIIATQTRPAATAAIAADGRAGRWSSLSEFAGEAIAAAVDQARERAGGALPPAPARLPNRLHR